MARGRHASLVNARSRPGGLTVPLAVAARAVAHDVHGDTVLTTLRSAVPLSLWQTTDGLRVVSSAFGPLGGDRTRLEVVVEKGAALDVGTVAAQVAQPGAHDPVSLAEVDLKVAAQARLCWKPRPLVVAHGAEHHAELTARVEAGGRLVLVDTVVLGRTNELPGRYLARWRVSYAGRPLYAGDLDIGAGATPGWNGPAVLGEARVLVTGLLVTPDPPADLVISHAEVMPLAGPGLLLSWLGSDALTAAQVAADFVTAAWCAPL